MSSQNDTPDQPSESSATSIWKIPPILAFVIGINKYISPKMPCLRGAVLDADTFERFLKDHLNVPEENIISLRDVHASRTSILSGFISLKDSPKYGKDEAAIIIYFAGHGAQIDKPEEWQDWISSSEHIEMLCPSDIGCPMVNGEECGDEIPGIPDRTISALLNDISDVKGNNITLILDCCCSAGIDRGEDSKQLTKYAIRQIIDPPQLKNSIDKELLSHGTRGGHISDDFSGKFHTSHVLLAACGRDQVAREFPETERGRGGLFTYSLMQVLTGNDINTLTYTSLIHKMKMPKFQTPHFEGQEVYRRLFNNRAPGAATSFILAKRKGASIVLEAGAAQGITVGSRMAVHASNLLETAVNPNPCLGYLTVSSVGPFNCVLEAPPDTERLRTPALFYCLVEYRASQMIALHCNDRHWVETVFPPGDNQLIITIVDDVQSCDLQLTVLGRRVYFDRHNVLVTPHIGTRIPYSLDVSDVSTIRNVVKSSLDFYHHLTRTGSDDFRKVRMELKNLKRESDDEEFDPVLTPIGKNLIEDEPAIIVVDEFAELGMTIFNQTDLPLYPYLFYFDPTDLTITKWYVAPLGAGRGHLQVDVPLLPKSMLTLGYGDGGVTPWQFSFREGEKKDIGFFKLFLSTRPANFSSILQEESPFDLSGMSRSEDLISDNTPDPERWATKLVTIIQVHP